MNCIKCKNPLSDGDTYCKTCGTPVNTSCNTPNQVRSLPGFILGLIASIFGLMGGLCTTMCSSLYSSGVAPFLLIFGGSILGLIGACKCLKNAKIGGIIKLAAAIAIIICAYCLTGSDFMTVIAMLLFLAGGAIGLVTGLANKNQ